MFSLHRIEKRLFCGRQYHLERPFCFGCYAGELRSGLSGWMHENAEVLELLTFWKRGTAGGSPFSNLVSSSPKDLLRYLQFAYIFLESCGTIREVKRF